MNRTPARTQAGPRRSVELSLPHRKPGDAAVGVRHHPGSSRQSTRRKTLALARDPLTGPTLALALPLFSQRQAGIARTEPHLEQSRARLRALESPTDESVRLGLERVAAAEQIAREYRQSLVPQRELIVKRQQERQNFMLVGQFELLLARQQQYESYEAYLESIRDYWLARVDLNRAIGADLRSVDPSSSLPTTLARPTGTCANPSPKVPPHREIGHDGQSTRLDESRRCSDACWPGTAGGCNGASDSVRPRSLRIGRGNRRCDKISSGADPEWVDTPVPHERRRQGIPPGRRGNRARVRTRLAREVLGLRRHDPGPTIEVVEGDRVRILVTTRLGGPTTIHWHGILLPSSMHGIGGLSQPDIDPGETYQYEFTVRQHGTHMYHPPADEMTQMAYGMMGLFIIHPRGGETVPVDRGYAFLRHNWALKPGTYRPDPSIRVEFDQWTFNGKMFLVIDPLVARNGESVRIRIGNLSMWNYPVDLHGVQYEVTGSDGGR